MTSPHDQPNTNELVRSVRDFLSESIISEVSDELEFHCRIAINILTMVERELDLHGQHSATHRARLEEFGVKTDAELADLISKGRLDGRYNEINAALRTATWDKLSVVNPKYVYPHDDPLSA